MFGRGTQIVGEPLHGQENLHHDLALDFCFPAFIGLLHDAIGRTPCLASVDHREPKLGERLVDAALAEVLDDLPDQMQRDPVVLPHHDANLDEVGERPQPHAAATRASSTSALRIPRSSQ